MLSHVVLLRVHPDVEQSRLDALAEDIRELGVLTAGPEACSVGPNVTEEPLDQGFGFGFVIRFASRDALAAYHAHPAHEGVSRSIQEMAETILAFDLEN